eukprot:TRINITY_DN24361_c0_g1_i1.p1 TRINITY_DN24361_c0_g1~~TRINITY_DN24361_c0_g1_i1.p1  ORF type:complete len:1090 (+),score=174.60 TRINITY_DN24361_c0_g1_i1:123-3392(+)
MQGWTCVRKLFLPLLILVLLATTASEAGGADAEQNSGSTSGVETSGSSAAGHGNSAQPGSTSGVESSGSSAAEHGGSSQALATSAVESSDSAAAEHGNSSQPLSTSGVESSGSSAAEHGSSSQPGSKAAGSLAAGETSSSQHGSLSAGHGEEHHESHDFEALVFLFCGVTFGTAVLLITMHPKLHNLQFTVVMFVLGAVFSFVAETEIVRESGMLIRSFHTWNNMDPHLILFVFLPALLFGDAMAIDTHVAKRCTWQCLFLAGPGVLLGAGLSALFIYGVLPWGWSFSTSLTVGSILAATDPVAVVGLLKQLGASPSLTIAIQGESLLNDGTAVVLFTVAYKMACGEETGFQDTAVFVISAVFGATLIGAIVGLISLWLIRKSSDRLNHHSPIVQICVTLCAAYWSFLIAEGMFHVSGVLSTVTAALVMAHRMWPMLVAREAMLEIWHVVETIGNALVFFLAGSMTGTTLVHTVNWVDYLWLLLVYLALTLIRFFMLVAFLPILNRIGKYHLSMRDVLVMTWGGLRGMVGLAFAILVRSDLAKGNLSQKDGDRILFLVGGIAGLTLLVNAPTCPALVQGLGITRVPEGRLALVRSVARRAQEHVEAARLEMFKEPGTLSHMIVKECLGRLYDEVNHHTASHGHAPHSPKKCDDEDVPSSPTSASGKEARRGLSMIVATLLDDHVANAPDVDLLWHRFDEERKALLNSGASFKKFKFGQQLAEMKKMLAERGVDAKQLKIVREVFLTAVCINYWEQLNQGKLHADSSLNLLLSSAKLAADSAQHGLCDWDILKQNIPTLKSQKGLRSLLFAEASPETDPDMPKRSSSNNSVTTTEKPWFVADRFKWLQKSLSQDSFQNQTRAFTMLNAFIEAHSHAQSQIALYFGEDASIDSPEEAFVVVESQCCVFAAWAHIASLDSTAQTTVNTMLCIHTLSGNYREFVLNAVQTGALQADEASRVLHPLEHEMAKIDRERRQIFKGRQPSKELNVTDAGKLSKEEAARLIQRAFLKVRVVKVLRRASTNISTAGLRTLGEPLGSPAFLRQISGNSAAVAAEFIRQISKGGTAEDVAPVGEITLEFDGASSDGSDLEL